MLLESIFPNLPLDLAGTLIIVSATTGTILMIYSQFVEAENWRDIIRMIGAALVAVYAFAIHNVFFTITFIGIFAASLIELIEILTGRHVHEKRDVEMYSMIGRKNKHDS